MERNSERKSGRDSGRRSGKAGREMWVCPVSLRCGEVRASEVRASEVRASTVRAEGQFLVASEAMTCGGRLSTIQSTHCCGFLQVASQHRVA